MRPGDVFNPRSRFEGVFIPSLMLAYDGLTLPAKVLLYQLSTYVGKDGVCCPRYGRLARQLHLSKRTVASLVQELREKRFIKTRQTGRTNYYLFLWHAAYDNVGKTHPRCKPCISEMQMLHLDTSIHSLRSCRAQPASAAVQAREGIFREMADDLHDAIRSIRKIDYTDYLPAWSRELEMLHKRQKVERERIQTVLKWYCKQIRRGMDHLKAKYIPHAFSGRAFRTKFDRIAVAMEKRGDSQPSPMVGQVLRKYIDRSRWGLVRDGLAELERAIVQWTQRAAAAIRDAEGYRVRRETAGVLECRTESLVKEYLIKVCQRIDDWSEWSGSFRQWSVGSAFFVETVGEWFFSRVVTLTSREREILNAAARG